jgi:predicted PhzF superfamily epimerase YddE/YHI9
VRRAFQQVDVFTSEPYAGNPVAVVLDGDGLDTEAMQRFARWTNLSETTFLLPPTAQGADYRLRIFTPTKELPFAGHPTLGSCHAWLSTLGSADGRDRITQECEAGLIEIRRTSGRLAFAADRPAGNPRRAMGRNGPGWVAVLLGGADDVLALRPAGVDLDVGVVGPYPDGSAEAFEVRAFFPLNGATAEDPVTGSLNASLAEWLLRTGRAADSYVASQGTALGRAGRVHISREGETIWVGGDTVACITGTVEL